MSEANTYEQYMLEIINIERAKAGVQPLAFNSSLNTASEKHSAWMDKTDTLSHTGEGGSGPVERMKSAGYVFYDAFWTAGENIAALSTRSPSGYVDEVDLIHSFFMGSSAHKSNILNGTFREMGIGYILGNYQGYESVFITQDFAATVTNPFLTGVAFDDKDGDLRYDINEGLGGFTVSAKNSATGAIVMTQTGAAGGYTLELASGDYAISFAGDGFATKTQQVTIGSKNVKLDLIDPAVTTGSTPTDVAPSPSPEPAPEPAPAPVSGDIFGTSGSDILTGTSSDDRIYGLAGKDELYGNAGNDQLFGGDGNDKLSGGAGIDVLTGGTSRDIFMFDTALGNNEIDIITDFSPKDDGIYLDDVIFSSLSTGRLNASAFYTGSAAHDATDRVIYNAATGALYYDADGTGAASAQQFVQLAAGLSLNQNDFYVV